MKGNIRLWSLLLLAAALAWGLWSAGRKPSEEPPPIPETVREKFRPEPVREIPDDDEEEETDPWAEALARTDLAALREVNPDVLGWIMIPETELSYPILQGEDNQYYLKRDWEGRPDMAGSIFVECMCAGDFSGFNTILYGHNMRNGSMFGSLRNYRNPDCRQTHPAIYILDGGGVRRYDIFAAHEVGVREIVYRLGFPEREDRQDFIDFCLERSVLDAGVIPEPEDQVVTLSTCTGHGYATRWVVQAVWKNPELSELSEPPEPPEPPEPLRPMHIRIRKKAPKGAFLRLIISTPGSRRRCICRSSGQRA